MSEQPDQASLKKALDDALAPLEHLRLKSEDLVITDDSSDMVSGGFSDVFCARLRVSNGEDDGIIVAVKQLRATGASLQRIRTAVRLARELKVWASARHPNILPLVGFHLDVTLNNAWLISPYEPNGNVATYLTSTQPDLTRRAALAADTAKGLAYLHSLSPPICHGDIKAANVLVNREFKAVLCDFGLSQMVQEDDCGLTTSKGFKGSTRYLSPELVKDEGPRTLASDVWAWGCLLLEILFDQLPYSGARTDYAVLLDLAQQILPADPYSLAVSETMKMLFEKCWDPEPPCRPTIHQCLQSLIHQQHHMDSWKEHIMENASDDVTGTLVDLPMELVPTKSKQEGRDWLAVVCPELSGVFQVNLRLRLGNCGRVRCLRFSDDGLSLAAGGDFGVVRIYYIVSGENECTLRHASGRDGSYKIRDLRFSPDGSELITAETDGKIHLWDVASRSIRYTFNGHKGFVLSIDVCWSTNWMVSCGADHTIRIWGLRGEEHQVLRIHKRKRRAKSNLQCVAIAPGASSVAAAGHDACVYVWDRTSGELKRKFPREEDAVRAMTFASDSSLLTASRCRQISRWIVDSDRESSEVSRMSLDREGSSGSDEALGASSKKALPADQQQRDAPKRERDSIQQTEQQNRKAAANRRPKHYYRPDGHIDVNFDATHPIFDLLSRAEKAWASKHEKASKTLGQAVAEYRRRYNRLPPPGFDKWWDYVQQHKVPLPDEYDRIYHDIEPFWAIDPAELAKSQSALERQGGTFTIISHDGKVTAQVQHPPSESGEAEHIIREHEFKMRAEGQAELLKTVQEWLPNFRATFGNDKLPSQFVTNRMRESAVRAARQGKLIDNTNTETRRRIGWAAACPGSSALARLKSPPVPDIVATWTNSSKSLVHDHPAAMDACHNPSLVHLSGFFQSQNPDAPATSLVPSFTTCTTTLHNDILSVPSDESITSYLGGVAWNQKQNSKLHWRGSSAGALYDVEHPHWNLTHRIRLVEATNGKDGEVYVLPGAENRLETVGSCERVETGWLNEDWMDVKFVGRPMGCQGGKGGQSLCGELEKRFEFKPKWEDEEQTAQWKYLIDIDEVGCSPRFNRLLRSRSLVFKATIHPEWYTDRIQPWLHYIPLKYDYSDLYDILAFFLGDMHGKANGHDAMAASIGISGRKWATTYGRREDMVAYVFRLFLEYARVMNPNRNTMNFEGP
ncbi:Glycosyltransferase Family 90 domain containing protein [Tulasnella sp. 424]|nr:Glycosyltransferase Family 90 domain containing protein [Tulasnella sp. 424]